MHRRILSLLLSLFAAALVQVATPVPAHAATPGGVFVTGHDPDFHAVSGNQAGARHITQAAVDYVTFGKTNPAMLLVTSRITPPPAHIDSALGLAAAGYTFDMASAGGASGTLDLATVDFTDYDVVVIASDHGGILTQAELDILNARVDDVIDYVNGGGGLVAFAESNQAAHLTPRGGHFDYLPFLVSEVNLAQVETGYKVTPFGASLNLKDSDVNGNFSHNVFSGDGGMNVVDVDASDRILSLATRGRQICHTGVPRASVSDVTQAEGTANTPTAFTFTVSLDIAPCAGPVTVDYATADGSALAGSDYASTAGTLTFPVGVTSQTVTVPVTADSTFEPDETFTLSLFQGGALEAQSVGTILNDDPQNRPPDCSSVAADTTTLWPPNHRLVPVTVEGGTDPDGDPVTVTVTAVTQDEALDGAGDGHTAPDAVIGDPANRVLLRAERAGSGDGRVYRLSVTASDGQGGTCTTTLVVSVPHDRSPGSTAVDSGLVVSALG